MLTKKSIFEQTKGYIFMLIACVSYALSTVLFLAPNSIVAGGISGLAVLFYLLNENVKIGAILIALNIPILLLGLKLMGWRFILKCLLTIVTLGVITDLLAIFPPMTNDCILAALYGGICQGIAVGLYVRYEFSSGGTELLGRFLSRKMKFLKIPVCVGILDGIIVVLGAIFTHNPDNMLYALIVIFVSTKISEIVLVGLEKSKLCIIVTNKGEEMSEYLVHNSPRGVTMLDGKGMYTKEARNVLLTCVKNRQLTSLKQMVKTIDENAFIIVNESVEVRGKGFLSLNQDK